MAESNLSTPQPLNPSTLSKIASFLSGKKTYLVAIAGIIYAAGIKYGHWPNDSEIWASLGFTGLGTLRAAIAKLCAALTSGQSTIDNRNSAIPDSAPAEAARRFTESGRAPLIIILAASLPWLLSVA
jgi:hypothetical protein